MMMRAPPIGLPSAIGITRCYQPPDAMAASVVLLIDMTRQDAGLLVAHFSIMPRLGCIYGRRLPRHYVKAKPWAAPTAGAPEPSRPFLTVIDKRRRQMKHIASSARHDITLCLPDWLSRQHGAGRGIRILLITAHTYGRIMATTSATSPHATFSAVSRA